MATDAKLKELLIKGMGNPVSNHSGVSVHHASIFDHHFKTRKMILIQANLAGKYIYPCCRALRDRRPDVVNSFLKYLISIPVSERQLFLGTIHVSGEDAHTVYAHALTSRRSGKSRQGNVVLNYDKVATESAIFAALNTCLTLGLRHLCMPRFSGDVGGALFSDVMQAVNSAYARFLNVHHGEIQLPEIHVFTPEDPDASVVLP